ncbi:hypothetical protein A6R68_23226 [Neotoma lepida]|uniref:Uncharacterized protein n=1 Tax=Neotoma lepida TaxID=56216 RepID=A0A1A6HWE6_NEOLE|nr:hypothetical protein A6R68_23226 [Neotoma lepida]
MRILTLCFISSSKKPKKHPEVATRPKPSPRLTIFDEEIDPDAGLFSPGNKGSPQRPLRTAQDCKYWYWPRDCSLWFPRVEEDLDQILNLGSEPKPKPQTKPKPLVPAKPALPRKPTVPPSVGPSETGPGPQKQQQIQAMDEMDILQYIQEQDTLAQASPSLF